MRPSSSPAILTRAFCSRRISRSPAMLGRRRPAGSRELRLAYDPSGPDELGFRFTKHLVHIPIDAPAGG